MVVTTYGERRGSLEAMVSMTERSIDRAGTAMGRLSSIGWLMPRGTRRTLWFMMEYEYDDREAVEFS